MESCPEQNSSGRAVDAPSVASVAVQSSVIFLIMLTSTVCNFLVAVAIVKRPDMISWSSNKLLLNLTVANLVLSVSVLPFVFASSVRRSWPLDVGWCTFNGFATNLLCTASLWAAMFLSIDRYHYIVNSLNYPNIMSVTKTYFFIGCSWAVSFFTAILPIAGWGSPYGFKESVSTCTIAWGSVQSDGYTKFYVSTAFIFPAIVMIWAYFHILKAARRQARVAHIAVLSRPIRGSVSSTASVFTGSKALWTTFMVLGALFFLWGPYVVVMLSSSRVNISRGVEVTVVLLSLSSTALYPVIYGFRVRAIKREIRRIVYRLLCFESRNAVRPISASDGGFVASSHFRNRSVSDGSIDVRHFAPRSTGIARHESSFGLPPISEEEDDDDEGSSIFARAKPTSSTGLDLSTEVSLPGTVT